MQDFFRPMVLENAIEDEPESLSFHREDGWGALHINVFLYEM